MGPIASANGLGRPMSNIIKILYTKAGYIDKDHINIACSHLERGGIIAVPTDTIYGIAAKVDDSNALDKIYKIKGRDPKKPLAVCLSSLDQIDDVADTKVLNERIIQSLLPGPTTILLPRSQQLNKDLNPGIEKIGVRIPDHNFIMALSHIVGPLALTSANRSGETSPLEVSEFADLIPDLDCVFDCGAVQNNQWGIEESKIQRLGSTVVDLSEKNVYKIVREGCALKRTINVLNRFGYRRKF